MLLKLKCIFAQITLVLSALESFQSMKEIFLANIEKHPYAVLLRFKQSTPAFCGASLIMSQIILTTASCTAEFRFKDGLTMAYLGSNVPRNSTIVRVVMGYKIHPNFVEQKLMNDVALELLETPVVFSATVAKVLLPGRYDFCEVGTFGTGAGWSRPWYHSEVGWPANSTFTLMNNHLISSRYRMIDRNECSKRIGAPVHGYMTKCGVAVQGQFFRGDIGAGLVFANRDAGYYDYVGLVLSRIVGKVGVYTYVQLDWVFKASHEMIKDCGSTSQSRKSAKRRGCENYRLS